MSDPSALPEPVRWQLPAIDNATGAEYPTAGKLEAIQKAAFDEAYEKGFDEGRKAGEDAARERAARLERLLTALTRPFDSLDEQIEKQLVELAMTALRQLFRREIGREPTHVIGVVREAIQLLPVASRSVQVHLHPDDAAIVRDCLAPAEGEPAWTIVEDPLSSRGGCRITSENSQIDATAETRLAALIQSIAGDQRA